MYVCYLIVLYMDTELLARGEVQKLAALHKIAEI